MKPFVKWAGGKSRLLKEIEQRLPADFNSWEDVTYVEPFVGGGSVLFHMLDKHPNISRVIINDINSTLIGAYRLIKENPIPLIENLKQLARDYYALGDSAQKDRYYSLRSEYNKCDCLDLHRLVLFLFLNRTCFNGLYRENLRGEFNVPHGRYKEHRIIDEHNLWQVHLALERVTILNESFESIGFDEERRYVFYYLDPPYRPIEEGGNMFTFYDRTGFNDTQQEKLKHMCDKISERKWYFMLSNSDSKRADGESYFEHLYDHYTVNRVEGTRLINTYNAKNKRPQEVIITNY